MNQQAEDFAILSLHRGGFNYPEQKKVKNAPAQTDNFGHSDSDDSDDIDINIRITNKRPGTRLTIDTEQLKLAVAEFRRAVFRAAQQPPNTDPVALTLQKHSGSKQNSAKNSCVVHQRS